MTRSPFPKSFFTPRTTARRAALRTSARSVAEWRRAAEAGTYHLIEKPPLVRNSGVWGFHTDWHRLRNRAGEHLARRPDFGRIEQAHRSLLMERHTPGSLDLTRAVAGLRARVSVLEGMAGVA